MKVQLCEFLTCIFGKMSVSFNFVSEDTVTSQYIVPVIDLCSDDDMKMVDEGDKGALKCQAMEFEEHTSRLRNKKKRMNSSHPPTEVLFDDKQEKVIKDVNVVCGKQETNLKLIGGKIAKKTTIVTDLTEQSNG